MYSFNIKRSVFMRKLLIMVSLLLMICLPAAANPFTVLGSEVEIGKNITVTKSQDKKGNFIYNFKAKDGNIWRGATLFSADNLSNSNIKNNIKLDGVLNQLVTEKFSKDKYFIAADKATLLQLGDKEAASVSIKMTFAEFGLIMNMNPLLVSTTDGIKMFMFVCADSDTSYWKPFFYKIVSDMP